MKKWLTLIGAFVVVMIALFMFLKYQKQIELGIVQAPNAILHTFSEPVNEIDEEVQKVAVELKEKLQKLDRKWSLFGLGLAAPQIGYSTRIIGIKRSYGDYQIMINPEVVEQKWSVPFVSTCFSLKGLHVLRRNLWMKVRYTDIKNNGHEEIFRWGRATVLQQEIDHINGVLVSD
ncbi:peptide deformylase [Candidatus Peregrinibacteria bacterium]|nr:peptide deformylase [Candidatus Peregrinibacteria bacterium]